MLHVVFCLHRCRRFLLVVQLLDAQHQAMAGGKGAQPLQAAGRSRRRAFTAAVAVGRFADVSVAAIVLCHGRCHSFEEVQAAGRHPQVDRLVASKRHAGAEQTPADRTEAEQVAGCTCAKVMCYVSRSAERALAAVDGATHSMDRRPRYSPSGVRTWALHGSDAGFHITL